MHSTQTQIADEEIREIFLTNGFVIKEGQTDLKPYVYEAARALLALANVRNAPPTTFYPSAPLSSDFSRPEDYIAYLKRCSKPQPQEGAYLGEMYIAYKACGCISGSCWDDPGAETSTAELLEKYKGRGCTIKKLARYQGQPMPDFDCETHRGHASAT